MPAAAAAAAAAASSRITHSNVDDFTVYPAHLSTRSRAVLSIVGGAARSPALHKTECEAARYRAGTQRRPVRIT